MAIKVPAGVPLPSAGKMWPVPLYRQEASEWCWLACAKMVGDMSPRNARLQQCDLAQTYVDGAKGCCGVTPPPDTCNSGGSADIIQKLYAAIALGFDPTPVSGQPSEQDLIAWLDKGPIQVFWSNPDMAHVALIVGVKLASDGSYQFTVNDPWPVGSGAIRPLSYDQLQPSIQSGYPSWDWVCVWHC